MFISFECYIKNISESKFIEFTIDNFTGKILRRQSGIVIGAGSQLGNFNGYVDNVSTVWISLFHQWFVLVEILWKHSLFVGITACEFRIRVESHKSKPLHFQSSETIACVINLPLELCDHLKVQVEI